MVPEEIFEGYFSGMPVVPETTGCTSIGEHPGMTASTVTDSIAFGGVTSNRGYDGQVVLFPLGTSVPSTMADAD